MSNKEERMNRNKSIIEDYKNGKPILEIAREYNLSETMCYKILKDTQEPPRYFEKKRKRLTTRNEQIVKQYKGGMTARELGKMYGISMQRIYAILHSSGEYESQKYNHIETALKKEKKMRNQTFLDAAMLEDAKAGMTDKEIAKKYFLSRSSVRTVLAGHLHTNSKKLDERRKAILADYEAGTSSKDICEKYGISKSTLYKDMRQIGKTCQEYYHKALKDKTNQRNSDIRSKIERGVSVSTIAKEYGISKTAIYETFHQENVRAGILQKRGRPRKNTERNALIAKRHREGEKVQALATEYNLSVSTVNTICSRNKNQNITSY